MSILFLILKIIGILILIPIILLLILMIFPICYQFEGDFDGKKPTGKAKVSWAVIFLRLRASYQDEFGFGIRVFGFPIYDSDKEHWSLFGEHKKKKKKSKKTTRPSDKKKKVVEKKNTQEKKEVPEKKISQDIRKQYTQRTSEDVLDISWDEKEISPQRKTIKKSDLEQPRIEEKDQGKKDHKEREFFGKKIVEFLKKCYNKCKTLFKKIGDLLNKMEMIGDIFSDEDIIDAVKRIKDYGINGVKLVLPQHMNAKITFGFEDPYYTGKILGLAAALIPVYGPHLDLTPDFEKQILKGKIKIKGSIRRYKILLLLWKIYKDKDDLLKQKDRALAMIGGN